MKNSFNNKYTLLILVLSSFIFSEMKIGYLNVDKILSELDEVRQVYVELEKEQWDMGQEKFETMVKEAKEHITKIEEAINEEQKELDSARADST